MTSHEAKSEIAKPAIRNTRAARIRAYREQEAARRTYLCSPEYQRGIQAAEEFHRQQRLEEFREIGRGIGEALVAAPPSESVAVALKALKAAGLGE